MPTIEDGKQAVSEGNLQQARLIFEAILQETPRSEEAWLGLAEVLTDNDDKRVCYENVLKINKNNRQAREGLRNLEPQANPFVAALQPPGSAPAAEEEADSETAADETMVSARPPTSAQSAGSEADAAADESSGPSYALVAIGLALSVIVFALGSGLVFYLLTSFTGG